MNYFIKPAVIKRISIFYEENIRMVIAIYCRKSVYRDTSDSIKNQIDMCKDFIKRCYGEGHTILVYD